MELALHPETKRQLDRLSSSRIQALLIYGPQGIGKHSLSRLAAARLLGQTNVDQLELNPYFLNLGCETNKVNIEDIRGLVRFFKLKTTDGHSNQTVGRVAVIENAQTMSVEAQNALLKTLEEPPLGSVVILVANKPEDLLTTVRSRLSPLAVIKPPKNDLKELYKQLSPSQFDKFYLMSAGLPGLFDALINDPQHQLVEATDMARQLLTQSSADRLLSVDALSKDRELSVNTISIISQMAEVSLRSNPKNSSRWQKVMAASNQALDALEMNSQLKLTLLTLMLSM